MTLRSAYDALPPDARCLTESGAVEIIRAARPHALAALGWQEEVGGQLRVSARIITPTAAPGGCLVPAWPTRQPDGSVVIECIEDWGVLLAAFRTVVAEPPDATADVDDLLTSGQRIWIGVANDVLQLCVPDPPPGTYSMVRHHALMHAAATLWLGPELTSRWRRVHTYAALAFLRGLGTTPLWEGIDRAERQMAWLLEQPRAHADAREVLRWLEVDRAAADSYAAFVGAASLGLAALLETVPSHTPGSWLREAVAEAHRQPGFNRGAIERFASRAAQER